MTASERYIEYAPTKYCETLQMLREIILNSSPFIEEKIAYTVPFF